jgi:tetratricopeptide (TPR) repeat protein/uncharacterized caspase-like protein
VWLLLLAPQFVVAEIPAGIVTANSGALVRHTSSHLALTAQPGELLFSGDVILTDSGGADVALCSQKIKYTLPAGGTFEVGAADLKATKGATGPRSNLPVCELPDVPRENNANLSTYGASMTRDGAARAAPSESLAARTSKLPAADQQAIQAADQLLAQSPDDLAALVTRATIYQRTELTSEALSDFARVRELAGGERFRGLVHKMDRIAPSLAQTPAADASRPPETYALLIGISHYQKLNKDQWLAFADQDAAAFAFFLESPRGGAVKADHTLVLTNERATTAAVRNGLHEFLDHAGPNDTVILLLAAHGVVDEKTGGAYIVTYDSDPEDLHTTAVGMPEIQSLMDDRLRRVGRALVYVDVCHAGTIGTIRSNNVNTAVEQVLKTPGQLLGFMATRSTEYAWEGENWGGGHGAFSYFILRGLSGEADKNDDGAVDVNELIEYVRSKVTESTRDQQHPIETVSIRNSVELADIEKPGVPMAPWMPIAKGQGRGRGLLAQAVTPGTTKREQARDRDVADFEAAIDSGRIIPETPGSAYGILRDRLMSRLTPDQYRVAENELRVALEDQGQQVLLRYLQGDQVTQDAQNFETGALYFAGARLLTPESLILESKELFCRGRALLFTRRFNEAIPLLERAARLDARGAYSFNALGIAYLEMARYDRAADAFRDAIRLAPYWVYPRHNLALAFTEQGQYAAAIAAYQDARPLAPNYSYVAYNLGHVYQRIRLDREAETSYRDAARIATKAHDEGLRPAPAGKWSERAEVWNALATLEEDRRHYDKARQLLRQALVDDTQSLSARHNLARLLSRQSPSTEAEQLWRQNLSDDPSYLASRFALAAYLERNGRLDEASQQYQYVLTTNASDGSSTGFVGTRELLSDVYIKLGRLPDAISALAPALKEDPGNPRMLEKTGDLYGQTGNSQKAEEAYQAAITAYRTRADQNRVRRKLRAAPGKTAK